MGWNGLARIDGVTWEWLGFADGDVPLSRTALAQFEITPTRTIHTLHAGGVDLTITYLSPIEVSAKASLT